MSKALTLLRTGVHAAVPGCPLPLIDQKISEVVRDFFRRSRIWKQELTAINVVAGTTDYTLSAPSGSTLVDVLTVVLDGRKIDRGFDFNISLDDTKLELVNEPTSSVTGGLVITVALSPDEAATTIEDRFYDRWHEGMENGAKYQLLVIPKKPWTDPEAAMFYRAEYLKAVERAIHRENFGKAAGGIKVRFPKILY